MENVEPSPPPPTSEEKAAKNKLRCWSGWEMVIRGTLHRRGRGRFSPTSFGKCKTNSTEYINNITLPFFCCLNLNKKLQQHPSPSFRQYQHIVCVCVCRYVSLKFTHHQSRVESRPSRANYYIIIYNASFQFHNQDTHCACTAAQSR